MPENNFITQPQLKLKDILNVSNIKTNFLITQENKVTLEAWLNNFKQYVAYLSDLINVETLINAVVAQLSTSKTSIFIDKTIAVSQIKTYISNGVTYQINRVDLTKIEITKVNDTNWNVNNLICQLKNENGVVFYPKIQTSSNKILIEFLDNIIFNYYLIIL